MNSPHTSQQNSLSQLDETFRRLGSNIQRDQIIIQKREPISKQSSISSLKTNQNSTSNMRLKSVILQSENDEKYPTTYTDAKFTGTSLLTPAELNSLYPNHVLLNTLKDSEYFGEIALKLHTKR